MNLDEGLFVLLQDIIRKELLSSNSTTNYIKQLDYLILTMLIDYRIKISKEESDNQIDDSRFDYLHNELDKALEHNRVEFEKIVQRLKE